MILGMSTATFTLLHVVISLVGILSGFVVIAGLWGSNKLEAWTALFLATTVATSVTGFMFPFTSFGPPEIIGALSLVILAIAILAYYAYRLAGAWRWIYIATALLAEYLNVFVGVVQAFQKIPALQKLAPTQSEGPFIAAQVVVMAAFIVSGVLAAKRFHPATLRTGAFA
jgi:hypothetical protein